MQRRQFLRSAIALGLTGSVNVSIAQDRHPVTPSDFEGPFYPVGSRDDDSNVLFASTPQAGDDKLDFAGELLSPSGEPWQGATIDIWHTDPNGRYRHPRDRGRSELRDDFRYWGKAVTDAEGRFNFVTLVPGAYSGRPAHIHYKVWQGSKRLLTSQIYFRELGGTRGASRHSHLSERQLATLNRIGDQHHQIFFRIVV